MRKNKTIIKLVVIFALVGLTSCSSQKYSYQRHPTITIDPGHGGSDKGSVGPTGLREKNVNLKVALRLKKYLSHDKKIKVILTRSNDKFLNLRQRVAIANKENADLFISVHHNYHYASYVRGATTYIKLKASEDDKKLAKDVHASILSKLKQRDMGIKSEQFYVIRHTKIPSILIEPSFLSNYNNEASLRTSSGQDKEAKAIYFGLRKYLKGERTNRKSNTNHQCSMSNLKNCYQKEHPLPTTKKAAQKSCFF